MSDTSTLRNIHKVFLKIVSGIHIIQLRLNSKRTDSVNNDIIHGMCFQEFSLFRTKMTAAHLFTHYYYHMHYITISSALIDYTKIQFQTTVTLKTLPSIEFFLQAIWQLIDKKYIFRPTGKWQVLNHSTSSIQFRIYWLKYIKKSDLVLLDFMLSYPMTNGK